VIRRDIQQDTKQEYGDRAVESEDSVAAVTSTDVNNNIHENNNNTSGARKKGKDKRRRKESAACVNHPTMTSEDLLQPGHIVKERWKVVSFDLNFISESMSFR